MKRARKNGNEKKEVLEPTHVIVTVLDGCYNEAPDFYYRALSDADSDFNIKTVPLLNEST